MMVKKDKYGIGSKRGGKTAIMGYEPKQMPKHSIGSKRGGDNKIMGYPDASGSNPSYMGGTCKG